MELDRDKKDGDGWNNGRMNPCFCDLCDLLKVVGVSFACKTYLSSTACNNTDMARYTFTIECGFWLHVCDGPSQADHAGLDRRDLRDLILKCFYQVLSVNY